MWPNKLDALVFNSIDAGTRHDLWCRYKALKEVFLDLYGIAYVNDDAPVAAHLEFFGDFFFFF
jgi:hypothetical protein